MKLLGEPWPTEVGPCPTCGVVPEYVEAEEFVSWAIPCEHPCLATIWPDRIELRPY